MNVIKGIIPAILTPMNEDESINEIELKKQVNRLIEAEVDGIFAFGTNGEGYALNLEEKERVLSIIVETVSGRVPVFAGTGCISTKDTIEMSKRAQCLGADVLSIITPWFAQASQKELYEHYKNIATKVDLPIVLYNIPARTGNNLFPDTVEELAKIENIVGIKDSSGNFDNLLKYIGKTKEIEFSVLAGSDSLILWNLMAGGTGGISGCANIFPYNMVGIYKNFVKGDLEKAKECQENIRIFRECFKYGNPNTIVKLAVEMLGYPVGKCRRPFNYISEEGTEFISNIIKEYISKGIL